MVFRGDCGISYIKKLGEIEILNILYIHKYIRFVEINIANYIQVDTNTPRDMKIYTHAYTYIDI